MKPLHQLIPSARAGKRFINIYRLLRASVEDRERIGFVGSDSGGEYQCALMLLAILTGYPVEATEILEALIKEQHKESWGTFLESVKAKVSKQASGGSASLPRNSPLPDGQRWDELLAKMERIKNNLDDRPCEDFSKWAPRVARYSFQSGRVLLHLRE